MTTTKQFCRVMVVTGALVTATTAFAAPKIEFSKTIYDFGTTSMVQSVTGTFTFQNLGDAPLEIQKPAPSCGCTVAGVKPSTVPPGGSGELTFTLNVNNHPGRLSKFINVPSNDPSNANVRLTIQLNVEQTFQITPQQVNFGMVPIGSTTNTVVEVKRMDGKPLGLTRAQPAGDLLKADIKPHTDSTNQSASIEITLHASGNPRRVAEVVQVFSESSGASPALMIQVVGQIVGDVNTRPDRLVFGIGNLERLPAARLERALTREVQIESTRADQTLELKEPVTTVSGLELKMVPVEAGRTYKLVAKFHEVPKQSVTGSITVGTNIPSQPTIEVPVTVNVIQR